MACVRVVVVWWLVRRTCLSTGWCSPGAVLHAAAHAQASAASRITYRRDPVIGQYMPRVLWSGPCDQTLEAWMPLSPLVNSAPFSFCSCLLVLKMLLVEMHRMTGGAAVLAPSVTPSGPAMAAWLGLGLGVRG